MSERAASITTGGPAPLPCGRVSTGRLAAGRRCFSGRAATAHAILLAVMVATPWITAGCQKRTEIPGGTPGEISIEDQPVANLKVNVYRVPSAGAPPSEIIAFGVSDAEGRFELRELGTLQPVWLEPGEYACTVESTGDIPLVWPREYSRPEVSSLRRTWTADMGSLDLQVPAPRPAR